MPEKDVGLILTGRLRCTKNKYHKAFLEPETFKFLDSLLLLLQTTQLYPSELLLELVPSEETIACNWQL